MTKHTPLHNKQEMSRGKEMGRRKSRRRLPVWVPPHKKMIFYRDLSTGIRLGKYRKDSRSGKIIAFVYDEIEKKLYKVVITGTVGLATRIDVWNTVLEYFRYGEATGLLKVESVSEVNK